MKKALSTYESISDNSSDCDSVSDNNSEPSLPSSQSSHDANDTNSEEQSLPEELENTPVEKLQEIVESWAEKMKNKSISFRLTWFEGLDHTQFRKDLQDEHFGFEAGIVAPEKGRGGKLHYQCMLAETDKPEFDKWLREYKMLNSWVDQAGKTIGGNGYHSTSTTRDPIKLLAYCHKEHNEDIVVWGIPEAVIKASEILTYTAFSKGNILKELEAVDKAFLLGETDSAFFYSYFSIWAKYEKNFNIKWLREHHRMLKWRKDPEYQMILTEQLLEDKYL